MLSKRKACVDVVVAVFNGADFIDDAMESVALQKEYVAKFIIIDDGSTDETAQKIQAFIARNPDLCVVTERQENQGASIARNRAIALGDAPYIAILDADDIWQPEKLTKQLAYLEAHSDCALLGTAAKTWKAGQEKERIIRPLCVNGAIQLHLCFKNSFIHSSVLFRREVLARTGAYPTNPPDPDIAGDYHLILRIARLFSVANLDEPLVIYRVRPESLFHSNETTVRERAKKLALEHCTHLLNDPAQVRAIKKLIALLNYERSYQLSKTPSYADLKIVLSQLTHKIHERFPEEKNAITQTHHCLEKKITSNVRKYQRRKIKARLRHLVFRK